MKKIVALVLTFIMTLASVNILLANENYAHREYVISEFIQAVGKNKFTNKSADLNVYSDSSLVDIPYRESIEIAAANNIVTGYNDNTLKPDNNITRAEAAVILSRCLGNVEITEEEKNFTDVPQWAEEDVKKLTQGGIISGYDDKTFGSSDFITVEQVKILVDKIEGKLNGYNLKDDYYSYYNEKFKRNNSLENGNAAIDNFDIVNNIVDERIDDIINTSFSENDKDAIRISSVYNLFINSEAREKEGLNSLKSYIEAIDNIKSIKDLPELEAALEKDLGMSMLLNFNVSVNPEDSSKYVIELGGSNTILPMEYYFNGSNDKIKNAYNSYVSSILSKLGDDGGISLAKNVYDFEAKIIQKLGTSNYDAYYTLTDRNKLNTYCKNIDAAAFLDILIPEKGEKVSVYNEDQLSGMDSYITSDNLDTIKAYYKANLITAYAPYLSRDIYEAYYSFSNSIYGGTIPSYEKGGKNFVKIYAGFAAINKYAEKYYNSEKEANVKNMIDEIKSYYKIKLQNNSWLSNETKEKAVRKLEKISVKVGYPKASKPYSDSINIVPVEKGGTLMSNIIDIEKIISQYERNLPDTSVNKNDWSISAFMVNACYVPASNEIIIPLGIMEEPFYNSDAGYYENLGSLGIIIAHEISHAFDPMGASFDENGNKTDWWTETDKNKFYDLADKIIKYFDKYEVVNGVDNDGENTLLENVADLAGVSCIIEITKSKGGDVKTVMESFAKTWNEISTDEYKMMCSKTDTHSAAKVRVNGVLSSINEFYEEYNIKEGDGMYKPPESRVGIW